MKDGKPDEKRKRFSVESSSDRTIEIYNIRTFGVADSSLEPNYSSSLEESATPKVIMLNRPIFVSADDSTEKRRFFHHCCLLLLYIFSSGEQEYHPAISGELYSLIN